MQTKQRIKNNEPKPRSLAQSRGRTQSLQSVTQVVPERIWVLSHASHSSIKDDGSMSRSNDPWRKQGAEITRQCHHCISYQWSKLSTSAPFELQQSNKTDAFQRKTRNARLNQFNSFPAAQISYRNMFYCLQYVDSSIMLIWALLCLLELLQRHKTMEPFCDKLHKQGTLAAHNCIPCL